jgi:signal transduction histidine kinase
MANDRPQITDPGSQFQDLRKHARRLERLLFVLVAIITILPTSVFFALGLRYLQREAERATEHMALLIKEFYATNTEQPQLAELLQKEMRLNQVSALWLTGVGAEPVLTLGHAPGSFLPIRAKADLPSTLAPFKSISIELDSDPLLWQSGRIFAIHLVVAALLVFLLHRFSLPAIEKAIEQLEMTQAQLIHSEKLGALGEIYAGLTHEINNPLGIMIGKLELALKIAKEHQLPAELTRDLEIVTRNGLRISELVRSLLIFSRKSTVSFTATALNHVITEVVELVDKSYTKQHIRIERRLDPKLPYCHASAGHLHQVFLGLMNNARDAMPQGGTITLRTYVNSHFLIAEVEDTGTGMAPDVKARIFEPFFTTKGVGKGTGLGLSVAYGIIKTHGGDITVESTPGKGSLFRLMLPIGGPSNETD